MEVDLVDTLEIISDVSEWLDYEGFEPLSREEETILKLFREYPIFQFVCTGMHEAGKLGF